MVGRHAEVGLFGFGSYVPARVMTNDDWAELIDTSDEWIAARTGIRRRHIAAECETTVDLAVNAALDALEQSGMAAEDLNEVVVATDTPEMLVPDTASFLQHRLRARGVPSYTLGGSGCAGFLQALGIASSRVQCGCGPILIVGVELLSRMVAWNDRNTSVLFGDAAGAVIIGAGQGRASISNVMSGTEGGHEDSLALPIGGTRHPFSLLAAQAGLPQKAVMKGREVFRHAVHWMAQGARRVLESAGLTWSDVALVIPHQANLRIIESMAKALEIAMDKVFVNVHEYGNTGSASIPLALSEAVRGGAIRSGDIVLLTSFGAGYHWAAAILRF